MNAGYILAKSIFLCKNLKWYRKSSWPSSNLTSPPLRKPLSSVVFKIFTSGILFFFFFYRKGIIVHILSSSLPRWLSDKRICLTSRRHRRLGFDPWVQKIPWRRKWQLIPVFLSEKPQRGAWQATVHSLAESDSPEHALSSNLLFSPNMQIYGDTFGSTFLTAL